MATEHYLEITDGVDTVTIADGVGGATSYKLQYESWAPRIGSRRESPLGGRGLYEDVVESMRLIVSGATVPTVFTNLAKLARLLDNAERWARGENTPAVLLKFSPKGGTVSSAANPMQAVILGRAPGDETAGVQLPVTHGDLSTQQLFMVDVVVNFRRSSPWLHTTATGSSAATNNSELVSISVTAVETPSPTKVELTNYGVGFDATLRRYHGGFLLLGPEVGGVTPIGIANAELGAGVEFTSVAGGDNARNTNVLRYTPTNTAEKVSGGLSFVLPASTDLVTIFISTRSPSTVTFQVRARLDSDIPNQWTQRAAIPLNSLSNYPYWINLGTVAKVGSITGLFLAVTAASAADFLDIDSVVVCDARVTQVLGLNAPGDDDRFSSILKSTLTIDHRLLTAPSPKVSVSTRPIAYEGDAVFSTKDAIMRGILLATGGGTGNYGPEWRQADTVTDVVNQNTWTLTRTAAYMVAQ